MKQFLENSLKKFREEGFEGVCYNKLFDNLYVVIGYNADGFTLACKIAVNCDDLQCDYDWDWNMPYDEEGVIDTEYSIYSDTTIDELLDHIAYWHFQLDGLEINDEGRIVK